MNVITVTDLGNGSVQFYKKTTGETTIFVKANTTWKSNISDVTFINTNTLNTFIYNWEQLDGVYSANDIETLFGKPSLTPTSNLSFGTSNTVSTDTRLRSILIIKVKSEVNNEPINNSIHLSQITLGNDCAKVSQFYLLVNPSFLNGGIPSFTNVNTSFSYVEKSDDNLFIDTNDMGKEILSTVLRSNESRNISEVEGIHLLLNTGDMLVICGKTSGNSKGDYFSSLIWKEFV